MTIIKLTKRVGGAVVWIVAENVIALEHDGAGTRVSFISPMPDLLTNEAPSVIMKLMGKEHLKD